MKMTIKSIKNSHGSLPWTLTPLPLRFGPVSGPFGLSFLVMDCRNGRQPKKNYIEPWMLRQFLVKEAQNFVVTLGVRSLNERMAILITSYTGVSLRILHQPKAGYHYCRGHNLNLVIASSHKQVPDIRNLFDYLHSFWEQVLRDRQFCTGTENQMTFQVY